MLVDGIGRNEFTFYEIFRLISNRLSEEFGGFVSAADLHISLQSNYGLHNEVLSRHRVDIRTCN